MAGVNGCLVVEDDDGALKTLFDHNSGAGFVPASSQKVLVAAAAALPPRPRLPLRDQGRRLPARRRTARLDDAWLVGGGDPYLATPDYAAYLSHQAPHGRRADHAAGRPGRRARGPGRAVDSRRAPHRRVPLPAAALGADLEAVLRHLGRGRLARRAHRQRGPGRAGARTRRWRPTRPSAPPTPSAGCSPTGVSPCPAPPPAASAPPDAVVIATVRSAPAGADRGGDAAGQRQLRGRDAGQGDRPPLRRARPHRRGHRPGGGGARPGSACRSRACT